MADYAEMTSLQFEQRLAELEVAARALAQSRAEFAPVAEIAAMLAYLERVRAEAIRAVCSNG